jgi:hypothetical protein
LLVVVKDNVLADIKLELVMLPAEVKSSFAAEVKVPELAMLPLVEFKVRSPDVELITAPALLVISFVAVKDKMAADIKLELVMFCADIVVLLAVI